MNKTSCHRCSDLQFEIIALKQKNKKLVEAEANNRIENARLQKTVDFLWQDVFENASLSKKLQNLNGEIEYQSKAFVNKLREATEAFTSILHLCAISSNLKKVHNKQVFEKHDNPELATNNNKNDSTKNVSQESTKNLSAENTTSTGENSNSREINTIIEEKEEEEEEEEEETISKITEPDSDTTRNLTMMVEKTPPRNTSRKGNLSNLKYSSGASNDGKMVTSTPIVAQNLSASEKEPEQNKQETPPKLRQSSRLSNINKSKERLSSHTPLTKAVLDGLAVESGENSRSRPVRTTRPTNLKEPGLVKKLRRPN